VNLEERLAALERSILPVWVYDHHRYRFAWANDRAVELWRAPDRAELLARDLSDLSPAVRTRLECSMRTVEQGGVVEEDWTFYPRGVPTTTIVHGSGVRLDDGRLAILVQAMPRPPGMDATMVRGVEAVRHSSLLISLLDADGRALFHNPAALRAFGDAPRLDPYLVDPDEAAAIVATMTTDAPHAAEVRIRTLEGERWHMLEARPTRDPVSGERAVLVQQLDVTARREAEGRVEAQHHLIEELNRSLLLVELQRQEILALSAPILDIGWDTLALPLIGRLDAERCAEISQRLLPAVGAQGADHVILDLTGAEQLDAAGAGALGRLVQAVELLGARPILTGIRAELARELIAAGIELEDLLILRSLRHGLEICMRRGPHPSATD